MNCIVQPPDVLAILDSPVCPGGPRHKNVALSAATVQASPICSSRPGARTPATLKDFVFYTLETQDDKFTSLKLTLLASTFTIAGSNTTADTCKGINLPTYFYI
jgi:hypothetical protein